MSSIREAIKAIKEQSSPQSIEFENFVAEFINMYSDLLRVTDDKIQFNIFVYSEGERSFRVRLAPKRQLNYYDHFWRITKAKLDTIIVNVLKNAGGIVNNIDDYFWEVTFFLSRRKGKCAELGEAILLRKIYLSLKILLLAFLYDIKKI